MDSHPNSSMSPPWPPAPNPQIYASQPINEEALGSICPFLWLDDGVVDTFIGRLCRMRPGQCRPILSTTIELVRILRIRELKAAAKANQEPEPEAMTNTDTDAEAEAEAEAEEEVPAPTETEIDEAYRDLRIQAATVTGTCGLVFMPFCLGDHWILAVGDLQYQVIRVYDSMMADPVNPSQAVYLTVVPIAKRILGFCLEEDQWTVELVWLPIERNATECGVYICMMALQHCCQPRFTHNDYMTTFRSDEGYELPYRLDVCYWLAARRIILQLCRRFCNSEEAHYRASEDEIFIFRLFMRHYCPSPVQQQFPGHNTYLEARSRTLGCVINALSWVCTLIRNLESPEYLEQNAAVHRQTLAVALTRSGEPFRDQVVAEVNDYARHSAEPLFNLMCDFDMAAQRLMLQEQGAQTRLANRMAAAAQSGLAGLPTGQPSSPDASSSTLGEDPTRQSPSTAEVASPTASGSELPETEL